MSSSKIRTPDEIYLPMPSNRSARGKKEVALHLFFVTGNPGLIAYYSTFLALLYEELIKTRSVSVYGTSLRGFEINGDTTSVKISGDSFHEAKRGPLDLKDQIEHILGSLLRYAKTISSETRPSKNNIKIILIGHSVGAYIILEILRTIRSSTSFPSSYRPSSLYNTQIQPPDFDVVGAILLFPTIMDLAASPKGRNIGWILRVPFFPLIADVLMRCITTLMPRSLFKALVQFVTQFPDDAAETTTAFLECRGSVRQALYMAKDELRTITSNNWNEDAWHTSELPPKPLKLFFLFGQYDHWVADHTRDQIMDNRNRETFATRSGVQPWMEIEDKGIPHSFCIRHSSEIAKKCLTFIEQII